MTQPQSRRDPAGGPSGICRGPLTRLGFDPGPVDGIVGARTEAAVKQLQRQADLVVDDIVGPKAWAVVNAPEDEGGVS
ncbi:MAG TPA: peptidoglycan-binding domain-containing protein [Euzebyales bacterium]|nr:peptidoglycan-binding domain-containing protein [Euzebyales bacterium]